MVDGECNVPAESDRAENRDVLARTDVEPDASRSTLWILVVLGGFLALAALWFAVFGNPEVIGALSASSVTSSAVSSGTQSDAQVATQATRSVSSGTLTLADVQGVIGTLDYEETSTKSSTAYKHAAARLLYGVDCGSFAKDALNRAESVYFQQPNGGNLTVSGAQKDALVAEALDSYADLRRREGNQVALGRLLAVHLGDSNGYSRQAALLDVVAQRLAPMGLLFGGHDPDNHWTWNVEKIVLTGTRTASVTYSATTLPGARWAFAKPSAHYTKHLVFRRAADGHWQLAAWTNYPSVARKFKANLAPPDSIVEFDEWWGTL